MLKHHVHHIGKVGYLMRAYEKILGADWQDVKGAFGREGGVLFNARGPFASLDWAR